MSKKIIPVLFVLILLAGCSANKELPQNTENTFSSVSKSTEVLQDEAVTDEPCAAETESFASSAEAEVIADPTKSREVEDTEPTFISRSNQQKGTVPKRLKANPQKRANKCLRNQRQKRLKQKKNPQILHRERYTAQPHR